MALQDHKESLLQTVGLNLHSPRGSLSSEWPGGTHFHLHRIASIWRLCVKYVWSVAMGNWVLNKSRLIDLLLVPQTSMPFFFYHFFICNTGWVPTSGAKGGIDFRSAFSRCRPVQWWWRYCVSDRAYFIMFLTRLWHMLNRRPFAHFPLRKSGPMPCEKKRLKWPQMWIGAVVVMVVVVNEAVMCHVLIYRSTLASTIFTSRTEPFRYENKISVAHGVSHHWKVQQWDTGEAFSNSLSESLEVCQSQK